MGDDRGRSIAGSGGNAVRDDLHNNMTGKHRTVGSVAADIQSLCKQEGLRGEGGGGTGGTHGGIREAAERQLWETLAEAQEASSMRLQE